MLIMISGGHQKSSEANPVELRPIGANEDHQYKSGLIWVNKLKQGQSGPVWANQEQWEPAEC